MKFDPNENYFTIEETAVIMKKTIARIRQFCKKKQLKYVIFGKKMYMIKESSIKKRMSEHHPVGRPPGYSPKDKKKIKTNYIYRKIKFKIFKHI